MSHLNAKRTRKVTYFHSKEPAKAYSFCGLKGEWESEPLDWEGVGVYLIEKKLDGHV